MTDRGFSGRSARRRGAERPRLQAVGLRERQAHPSRAAGEDAAGTVISPDRDEGAVEAFAADGRDELGRAEEHLLESGAFVLVADDSFAS
jgi:hypothetical protein